MHMQVNLLPAQFRPKPPVRIWPVVLAVVLMLNLIITSSYWLTLHLSLIKVNNSINSMEVQVSNLQRQVDEAHWKTELEIAVQEKADYISAQLAQLTLWHPALTAIENAMVPKIRLTEITCAAGNIKINGSTESFKSVAAFLGSLQQETDVEIVRFISAEPPEKFSLYLFDWYRREVPEDE